MCDSAILINRHSSCRWQESMLQQVKQRNAIELEPMSSVFSSYNFLRNQACLSINAETVIARLHQEREMLSARVRDLERAVADNSVRSLLELDQRNRYEVLLNRLQIYESHEKEYKETKEKCEEAQSKVIELESKLAAAENVAKRCQSELSLMSKEYAALKDENTQMRRRITDADRCVLENNNWKLRAANLQEQINTLQRQIHQMNANPMERNKEVITTTLHPEDNNTLYSSPETSRTATHDDAQSSGVMSSGNDQTRKNSDNSSGGDESKIHDNSKDATANATKMESCIEEDRVHNSPEQLEPHNNMTKATMENKECSSMSPTTESSLKSNNTRGGNNKSNTVFQSENNVKEAHKENEVNVTKEMKIQGENLLHDNSHLNSATRYYPHQVAAAVMDAHRGNNIHAICALDNMKKIATAGADKLIRVWSLHGINGSSSCFALEEERRRLHTGNSVALSLHGVTHYLLAGCADHLVRLWDLNTLRGVELAGHEEKIVSVCLSNSAQHAFTASSDSTIKVWDVRQRMALRTFLCTSTANDVIVSGGNVISAHYNGTVVMWDRRTATRTCETRVHGRITTCVRVSSDGLLCVSLGRDNNIAVRDTRMIQRPLYTFTSPDLVVPMNWSRLGLSEDNRICAVGSSSGEVLLFAIPQASTNYSFSSESLELSNSLHTTPPPPPITASADENNNNTSSNNTSMTKVLEVNTDNAVVQKLHAESRQPVRIVSSNQITGHERNKPVYGVTWFTSADMKNSIVSFGEDRRIIF